MLAGQATVRALSYALAILKVQLAEVLPLASVAWQVTVLVPFGKVEPLGGVQLAVEPEQLSLGVAAEVCGADSQLSGADVVVMLAGQATVGACSSFTVTVKV